MYGSEVAERRAHGCIRSKRTALIGCAAIRQRKTRPPRDAAGAKPRTTPIEPHEYWRFARMRHSKHIRRGHNGRMVLSRSASPGEAALDPNADLRAAHILFGRPVQNGALRPRPQAARSKRTCAMRIAGKRACMTRRNAQALACNEAVWFCLNRQCDSAPGRQGWSPCNGIAYPCRSDTWCG